ncbi:MAG: GNAT family N-acetyltransferase [Candidatus Eremiobacteraeota bacterium]|nr:GNAT family N-acetyltransferase [Candidatus Eremiobacteraeota bacterium]
MAISEMFTDSMVMGQATFEGVTSIRQWFVRLYELEACEHGGSFGKRTEIGHARLFTVPELSQDSLHESDVISGDLETVVTALVENEDRLWAPVLILDELYVKPKYRGRGLAEEVAKAAFAWFEGLVNSEAITVTTRPKFRPAATRIVEKLGFRPLKDDIWVRTG